MNNEHSEHRGKGRPRAFDRDQALHAALELFWQEGYEPASVARLCEVMDIKPPSLYASFGNKAALFLEAVRHYEEVYWQEPSARFLAEPDVYRAVEDFFATSARILLSPETPCGCMLVLAAVNMSPAETEIIEVIRKMRMETKAMFAERLKRAVAEGQIPQETDIAALAGALNALLEGLSLQARDGLSREELAGMAARAVHLLPPRGATQSCEPSNPA